jgi:hypothetical protein
MLLGSFDGIVAVLALETRVESAARIFSSATTE